MMHDGILYTVYFVAATLAIIILGFFVLRFANRYIHLFLHLGLLHGYISVVVIESGQYIAEQGVWGTLTFSALRLYCYLVIFYLGWYFATRHFISVQRVEYRHMVIKELFPSGTTSLYYHFALVSLFTFLAVWLGFIILNWPPPLLREGVITRFLPVEERNLFSGRTFSFVPIVLGYIAFRSPVKIRVGLIYGGLASYFILLLLNGQKYGGFTDGLIYFFAARYIMGGSVFSKIRPSSVLKIAALLLVLFSVLLTIVLWHYQNIAPSFGMDPIELLFQRIFVLQGHLWWAVDNIAGYLPGIATDTAFTNNSFMIGMMQIANSNIDIDLINIGMSGKYTFGFPAVMPYIMGHFFGVIFCFFVGMAVGVILSMVETIAMRDGLLRYLFSIYVYITILTFVGTGDFFIFNTPRSIVVILIFSLIVAGHFCHRKLKFGQCIAL